MMHIVMPRAGQTMEEGVVLRWLKQEGDEVRRGEVVVEIETDKAVVELEAESAGVLRRIVVPSGQTVPVLSVLAYLGDPTEEIPSSTATNETSDAQPTEQASRSTTKEAPPAPRDKTIAISPRARKLAAERHVDVSLLSGTGAGGRITEADVEKWLARSTPPNGTRALSKAQISLGKLLQNSVQTAPHFYLSASVNVDELLRIRSAMTAEPRPTVTSWIVKAVGFALRDCPDINCRWDGERLVYNEFVNVGMAIDVDGELLVGVVTDVDKKSLEQVAEECRLLVIKAKQRKLVSHRSSLTISNLGPFGVDQFTAIINPPEIAILAAGQIVPVVQVADANGKTRTVNQMTLTLSCDHRALNGAQGAQFVKQVRIYLEAPMRWHKRGES